MKSYHKGIKTIPIASLLSIVSLLYGVTFVGCSSHKAGTEVESIVKSFPITEDLPGKRVDLQDGEYLSNLAGFAGDYLVFRAIRAPYYLQIYDLSYNLVDTILHHGEGPDELPDAMWYGQWTGDKKNPTLTIYSSSKLRIADVNIHPFDGIKTVCDLPVSEGLSPSSIYTVNDSILFGIDLSIDKGADLFSYNPQTNVVKRADKPFKFIDSPLAFYTSQQTMCIDSTNKEICCAYLKFPSIVIYDFDFNIRKIVNIGIKIDTSTYDLKEQYPNLTNICYYKNFITVMRTDGETKQADILVFDRNGEPKASYSIGKAVGYTIDSHRQQLLSIKIDEENDVQYIDVHELPEFLTK